MFVFQAFDLEELAVGVLGAREDGEVELADVEDSGVGAAEKSREVGGGEEDGCGFGEHRAGGGEAEGHVEKLTMSEGSDSVRRTGTAQQRFGDAADRTAFARRG